MTNFFQTTKRLGRSSFVALALLCLPTALLAQSAAGTQPSVHIEPLHLEGPLPLRQQTATAVIRDYLQSWPSLNAALDQNRADLLDADFVGTARTKLAAAIHQQAVLGLHTRYQDRSHDLRIVFYSPDGLSIQLIDNVEYQQQVFDHDKLLTSQLVHVRYIVVMTPAELRWRVRILQSEPE